MANITNKIKQTFKYPNIAASYGPYQSKHAAHLALVDDGLNIIGMTVGIEDSTTHTIKEWWYQGGTTEADLVEKQAAKITVDDTITENGTNPVKGSAIYSALGNKANSSDIPDVSNFITNTVNDLVNYYKKTETYSKSEVNNLLAAIKQFTYQSVQELPTASVNTTNKIYLVPSSNPETQNTKDEYITIDHGDGANPRYTWEQIGSTAISLEGYITTDALNTALANYTTTADLNTLLAAKITMPSSDVTDDGKILEKDSSAAGGVKWAPKTPQSYVHIKYADDASGTNISDTPLSTSAYIGVLTDNNSQASSTASDYTWAEYKGPQGTPGHNPNLGSYTSLADAPTTNIQDGDYIVLLDTTQTPVTGVIFKWDGSAWQSTGRDANMAYFGSGELLSDVHIINNLEIGGQQYVLSAEQGKVIGDILNDTEEQVWGDISDEIVEGKYISGDLRQDHMLVTITPQPDNSDPSHLTYGAAYIIISNLEAGNKIKVSGLCKNSLFSIFFCMTNGVTTNGLQQVIDYQIGDIDYRTNPFEHTVAEGETTAYITLFNYDPSTDKVEFSNGQTTQLGLISRVEALENEQDSNLKNADIVNNLTSGGTDKPLSAEQGKILNDKIFGDSGTELQTEVETGVDNQHPARINGEYTVSGYFKRYVVDLSGLYEEGYRKVRFFGYSYQSNSNISAGLVTSSADIDTTVVVDSYVPAAQYECGYYDLPLTQNSQYLIASVLTSDGVTLIGGDFTMPEGLTPAYIPETVVVTKDESEPSLADRVETLEEEIGGISTQFPMIFIPKKIYGVIGETMQIFKRGVVISQTPYRFYSEFYCNQGKEYERYLEITPELVNNGVPTGLTIRLSLIDDYYKKSPQISSDLILANKPTASPSNNINVLCVGASTTANGEWPSELKRRLVGNSGVPNADGLSNITFVGRIPLPQNQNRPVDVNVEATGGWQWKTFYTPQLAVRLTVSGVTSAVVGDIYKYVNVYNNEIEVVVAEVNVTAGIGNIRFTFNYNVPTVQRKGPAASSGTITRVSGSGNQSITYTQAVEETYCPFYDEQTQQPDFAGYAHEYCNDQIDVAIFNLGNMNASLFGDVSMTTIISEMKTLLDALHTDFPYCKVIVAPGIGYSTLFGLENNYSAASSARTWAALFAQFKYAKAVEEFILTQSYAEGDDYKDWCFLADTIGEVDSENVFPIGAKALNQRYANQMVVVANYSDMVDTSKIYLLRRISGGYYPNAYEYKNGEWVVKEGYAEIIGTNGAHPELIGYQMTADAIYRCFVNVVLN